MRDRESGGKVAAAQDYERQPEVTMKPVMLALSTFRQTKSLAEDTLALACSVSRPVLVLYVVDINLDRYLLHSGLPRGTSLRGACEAALLSEHRLAGEALVGTIGAQAKSMGLSCESLVVTGRFGIEVVRLAHQRLPLLISLTRSHRPQWVRRLFGSPVDYIMSQAGCPVLEDCRGQLVLEQIEIGA